MKMFDGGQNRSVAAAATDDLTVPLPYTPGMHNYITGFVVFPETGAAGFTGLGGTAVTPAIFDVEVWLIRGHNRIPLDYGWACYDAKNNRAVVGFAGRVGYNERDSLFIAIKNAGTGTASWGCSGTYDQSENPISETGVIHRLHDDVTFIYQARRVCTNANAAGNPIVFNITMATGQVARLIALLGVQVTAGVHTLLSYLNDEDNASYANLANIAAAANTSFEIPSIGANATTSANITNSLGLVIPAGAKLNIQTYGASAQAGDTLTVGMILELLNDPTLPTWAATGTDSANFTFAASTISDANTLIPIIRPRLIG